MTAHEDGSRAGRVLVVDDDPGILGMLVSALRAEGHAVEDAAHLAQARAHVRARPYDVVVTDLMLGMGTGLDLLREIKAEGITAEVIIMTGRGSIPAAIEAIRQGAYHFVTKPVDVPLFRLDVAKALDKKRLEDAVRRLSAGHREGYGRLVGQSAAMRALYQLLDRAASTQSNVLLLGESGTGKELAARALHDHSPRCAGPFVAVNCGALPPELLESELFGHVRGAYTGADRERRGLFGAAHGGTIFLDEIGAAPARVQVGLLRVLQERVVRPVGSETDHPVDVRVVAATNSDLENQIAHGDFRQDLYYRLATIVVRIPPLRERREDIPLLVGALLERAATRTHRRATLSPGALERLIAHDWPGNVRELEHMLERAAVVSDGDVIRETDIALAAPGAGPILTLEELERDHIRRVLTLCGGNKLRAARLLGIPRGNLYRRLERYGLDVPDAPPDGAPSPSPVPAGAPRVAKHP